MTPFRPWERIAVVQIPYQTPQIKCSLDRIQLQRSTWQSEAIWYNCAFNDWPNKVSSFSTLCERLERTPQSVEQSDFGTFPCSRAGYLVVEDVVNDIDQDLVIWQASAVVCRNLCHFNSATLGLLFVMLFAVMVGARLGGSSVFQRAAML